MEFVTDVYENVKGTLLEKTLAHLGGVRMTKDEIIAAGQNGHGRNHYPTMHWSDNSLFYQSVQDLSNYAYATWLQACAREAKIELPSNNQEKLGDMVEAALGLCHLASRYLTIFKTSSQNPITCGED